MLLFALLRRNNLLQFTGQRWIRTHFFILYYKQFIFDWNKESLKFSSVSNKKSISNFSSTENSYKINETQVIKVILKLLSKLVESLLFKLLKPSNKCRPQSVFQYYSCSIITDGFCLIHTWRKYLKSDQIYCEFWSCQSK